MFVIRQPSRRECGNRWRLHRPKQGLGVVSLNTGGMGVLETYFGMRELPTLAFSKNQQQL